MSDILDDEPERIAPPVATASQEQTVADNAAASMTPKQRDDFKHVVDEAFKDPTVRSEFADIIATKYGTDPHMQEFLSDLQKSVEDAGRGHSVEKVRENSAGSDDRADRSDMDASGANPVSPAVTADRPDANQQVSVQPKPRVQDSVGERQEVVQEPDTVRPAPTDKDRERRETNGSSASDASSSRDDAPTGVREKDQFAHDRRDLATRNEVAKMSKQNTTKQNQTARATEAVAANKQNSKENERPAQTDSRQKLEPRSRIETYGRG